MIYVEIAFIHTREYRMTPRLIDKCHHTHATRALRYFAFIECAAQSSSYNDDSPAARVGAQYLIV